MILAIPFRASGLLAQKHLKNLTITMTMTVPDNVEFRNASPHLNRYIRGFLLSVLCTITWSIFLLVDYQ